MVTTPNYEVNPRIFPAHHVNVIRTTNLSVPNNQLTVLSWEAATADTAAFWKPATPSLITAKYTGLYAFGIEGTFAAVAGNRTQRVVVKHNGDHAVVDMQYSAGAGLAASVAGASLHSLQNGDTLECSLFQDSGGALDFVATSSDIPHFWLVLLGY